MGENTMAKTNNSSAQLKATISEQDIEYFKENKTKDETKVSLKQFVENNREMLNKLKKDYTYENIATFLRTKYSITTTGNTLKTLLADTGSIYSKMDDEKLHKHYEILCQKLNIKTTQNTKAQSSGISPLDLKKLNHEQLGELFSNTFQLINQETHPEQYELVRSCILENTDYDDDENLKILLTKIKTLKPENISKISKAIQY